MEKKLNDIQSLSDVSTMYGIFRDYVKHEDFLVVSRLTHLLSIHGFLYAAYGFTIQKELEVSEKLFESINLKGLAGTYCNMLIAGLFSNMNQNDFFVYCIAAVGFSISLFGLVSILAAIRAGSKVRRLFHQVYRTEKNRRFGIRSTFEFNCMSGKLTVPSTSGGGSKYVAWSGSLAPVVIPIVLMLSWMAAAGYVRYYKGSIAIQSQADLSLDSPDCKQEFKRASRSPL